MPPEACQLGCTQHKLYTHSTGYCKALTHLSIYLSIYLLISNRRPNNPSLSGTACKLISLGEYRRGTLASTWSHFGVKLEAFWGYFGSMWMAFGDLWATLRSLWAHFGITFGIWGWLWVTLEPLWDTLRPRWTHFARTLGSLCADWGHFGRTLGSVWATLGSLCAIWGHFGLTLGSLWAHFGSLWGHFEVTLGLLLDNFGLKRLFWSHFGPFPRNTRFSNGF